MQKKPTYFISLKEHNTGLYFGYSSYFTTKKGPLSLLLSNAFTIKTIATCARARCIWSSWWEVSWLLALLILKKQGVTATKPHARESTLLIYDKIIKVK